MATCFHVAGLPLAVGSVIEPGNWGRLIKFHPTNSFVAHREAVYEIVRMKEFPGLPSRLESLFCLDSLQEAAAYRHNLNPSGVLYEVELTQPECLMHRGILDYVAMPPQGVMLNVHELEEAARKYWRGAPPGTAGCELVAVSAARILRRCQ